MKFNFKEELKKEKNNLSSFYIIIGNFKKNKEEVNSFLNKDLKLKKNYNLEFYLFQELNLSINKVREITKINFLSQQKENFFRVFFIETQNMSEITQNALLKTVEDVSENTIFFLFLSNNFFILDTLKSRARIIYGYENDGSKRAQEFLEKSFLEREKIMKKIEKVSKENSEIKNEYLNFLTEIEVEILNNRNFFKVENFSEIYKKFLELKEQVNRNKSSVKYVMVFLAIYLPQLV